MMSEYTGNVLLCSADHVHHCFDLQLIFSMLAQAIWVASAVVKIAKYVVTIV